MRSGYVTYDTRRALARQTFTVGQEVVTRRGKRGTVTAVEPGTVHVRFGGKTFPMKPSWLVTASAYRRITGPRPPQRV